MIRNDHRTPGPGEPSPGSTSIPELTRIITIDPQLQRILHLLPVYARVELPVLILGEPGTGKELIAEAIWSLSLRGERPLVKINCAALTETLAGSELFGHVRGSFTDARHNRAGKFKMAHKGTLFLDEVGDLPASVQPRLLRAVEQGEIEPVGGDVPLRVDVRLVAASNQSLTQLITRGRFRQDLYDRLGVLLIHLPPLKERRSDILLLAHHFAKKAAQTQGKAAVKITKGAARRLLEYPWPGNVRELKNVITRAVLLATGPKIWEEDLHFTPSGSIPEESAEPASRVEVLPPRPTRGSLEDLLFEEKGNISALSRRLKVCTKTIYRWLRNYQINLEAIRSRLGFSS